VNENGKTRQVETVPGNEGGLVKDNDGRGKLHYDIVNFGTCYNIPTRTTIKKKRMFPAFLFLFCF
jgi:hypothetical protein